MPRRSSSTKKARGSSGNTKRRGSRRGCYRSSDNQDFSVSEVEKLQTLLSLIPLLENDHMASIEKEISQECPNVAPKVTKFRLDMAELKQLREKYERRLTAFKTLHDMHSQWESAPRA